MVLVKDLELLFDGRIRVVFFGDASTYLIPMERISHFLWEIC